MAVLMLTVRLGDRSLPLAWLAEAGAATIGFSQQKILLDKVREWLPAGAAVMLLADRFYPSVELFQWLEARGWQYRLRLKGNLVVDTGRGDETTTGHLAQKSTERYWPNVRLFGVDEVMTNIGIIHDEGHPEPWIIAMDCPSTRRRSWITAPVGGFALEAVRALGTVNLNHGFSHALVCPRRLP